MNEVSRKQKRNLNIGVVILAIFGVILQSLLAYYTNYMDGFSVQEASLTAVMTFILLAIAISIQMMVNNKVKKNLTKKNVIWGLVISVFNAFFTNPIGGIVLIVVYIKMLKNVNEIKIEKRENEF